MAGIAVLTNSATEEMLQNGLVQFDSLVMASNSPQASLLAEAIQTARAGQPQDRFHGLEPLLAVPALTLASPFLNLGVLDEFSGRNEQLERGLSDEAIERIPVQLLPRLRLDSFGTIARAGGGWCLHFTGLEGFPYLIQTSTNLLDWQTIATNHPVNGLIKLDLPPDAGTGFFRSAWHP